MPAPMGLLRVALLAATYHFLAMAYPCLHWACSGSYTSKMHSHQEHKHYQLNFKYSYMHPRYLLWCHDQLLAILPPRLLTAPGMDLPKRGTSPFHFTHMPAPMGFLLLAALEATYHFGPWLTHHCIGHALAPTHQRCTAINSISTGH